MRAILICPARPENVAVLAEAAPLAVLPMLGKPLIEYWLEQLAMLGAREIFVSAADRPENVAACVEDGARWGLCVKVLPAGRELTPAEARAKFRNAAAANWLPAPQDVALMDRLPQQPERPLFASYAAWFAAVMDWLPRAAAMPDRIGVREIKPGVWIGLHSRVAAKAVLRAPCWIGENVFVGASAVVGPEAVVENKAFVDRGAEIFRSVVGPETFVGEFTEIRHSLALGDTLVNWQSDSALRVPDEFLLRPLKPPPRNFAPQPIESKPLLRTWKFSVKTEP